MSYHESNKDMIIEWGQVVVEMACLVSIYFNSTNRSV